MKIEVLVGVGEVRHSLLRITRLPCSVGWHGYLTRQPANAAESWIRSGKRARLLSIDSLCRRVRQRSFLFSSLARSRSPITRSMWLHGLRATPGAAIRSTLGGGPRWGA